MTLINAILISIDLFFNILVLFVEMSIAVSIKLFNFSL